MERRSFIDYLDVLSQRAGECAYVQRRGYRTERWTYGQVIDAAARFANELDSRGVKKGDRVIIWGPNSAQWVAAFWGCVLRGVIAVPMDNGARPEFALRVHKEVGAALLVSSHEHAQTGILGLTLEELSETVAHHPTNSARPALEPADTLEIVFTSGTTSEPKGVVISHGNVLSNIAPLELEIRKYLKYERWVHPVRFLNLLPLSHVFGQFLGMFLPPLMGGTVVFQDTLNPAEVMATIRKERVTVLVAVPRMLQSLKEKVERDIQGEGREKDFAKRFQVAESKKFLRRAWIFRQVHRKFGWKFWAFISGGAALDRSTEEFWSRLGYAAIQGYGLTETTSLISVNHPFRVGKGSIGKVLAGREVKLAPDGEIIVRGGGVASGYWNEAVSAKDEGWYHTGDLGELDEQGNLYFKGRKKDVIVTPAGMNIYPHDLEAALRLQPEVKDCVVIALPRDGNAEGCAVLISNRDVPEEIIRRANLSLAEYQRIHRWFLWPEDDFPRTSTGKPRTDVILQAVLAESKSKPVNEAASPLSELIARVTGREVRSLHADTKLDTDLALDSLGKVALLGALEDRYQIDLSETSFAAANTISDLEKTLRGENATRVRYHYPAWVRQGPIAWIRFLSDYLLLYPSVFLLGWPRVDGRENLRGVKGPVLVISNHIGDVDLGLVRVALTARLRNRLVTAAGGEALEALRTPPPGRHLLARWFDRIKWVLGVSLLNLFPLPREAGFRESFAYAGESVDRGFSVLVFPEGRHTTDGKLLPFRAGIGLLANHLRIPVVPLRIDGLFAVKQAGRKFAWPHEICIKVGRPVQFPPDQDAGDIARELQRRVAGL